MSGLFATLNTSKGGMFAQQQYINVTSHNISNANTEGFSRQHIVLQTARPQTIAGGAGQIGTGVTVSSIERTRNQFLDYQIRKESSLLGNYGVRQDYLSEIEGIFNEPSDTGISELMSEFFDAWQTLSKNPEKSDARTVVAQKAKALADELNHTYKKLNDTKDNAAKEIQSNLFEINTTLDQLNSINKEIITVTIAGNNPNDLLDSRDLLLDELSTKFGIDTRNQILNGITCKPEDNLDLSLIRNKDSDGINKFAYVNKIDNVTGPTGGNITCDIEYYKNGDTTSDKNKVTLKGVTLSEKQYEDLKNGRVLVTDENGNVVDENGNDIDPNVGGKLGENSIFNPSSGRIGGLQSIHEDAESYIEQANTLAKTLAFAVNAIHTEGIEDKDKQPFFVNSGNNPFDYDGITAGNIGMNSDILKNVMLIQAGASKGSGSTDGDRALALASLRDFGLNIDSIQSGKKGADDYKYVDFVKEHFETTAGEVPKFKTIDGGVKVEGFFKNTINKLGVQSEEATRIVKNQNTLLKGLLERRLSTSGVSLDEEAINLVQFQHAFQANAKVITTVDQLLDVVIGLVR
ncbi:MULTISPECIES: flagellar hook-associated protein FlgK [unclassified Clostridium]|uniref:flagellar hook-associated protein FlgK n=1 Tax=unclassified Clostridium TaxID=2614128 RepID=UPI003217615E